MSPHNPFTLTNEIMLYVRGMMYLILSLLFVILSDCGKINTSKTGFRKIHIILSILFFGMYLYTLLNLITGYGSISVRAVLDFGITPLLLLVAISIGVKIWHMERVYKQSMIREGDEPQ